MEKTASYNSASTGESWGNVKPELLIDPASTMPVVFSGTAGEKTVHEFPVSVETVTGLLSGKYTSIAIRETGGSYRNIHFGSREGSTKPELVLYRRNGSATFLGPAFNRDPSLSGTLLNAGFGEWLLGTVPERDISGRLR